MDNTVTSEERPDRIEESVSRLEDTVNRLAVSVEVGFERMDRKFDEVDRKLEGMDEQFDRIAATIVKEVSRIDKTLEAKADKEDVRKLIGAIDDFARRVEISEEEQLVMGHQLERLNRWTMELAAKIGVKLST